MIYTGMDWGLIDFEAEMIRAGVKRSRRLKKKEAVECAIYLRHLFKRVRTYTNLRVLIRMKRAVIRTIDGEIIRTLAIVPGAVVCNKEQSV